MGLRVAVVGAGIGGLATGIRLARAGHHVDVLDRDPSPPASVSAAFDEWHRQGVTQWRQYHVFLARARLELARSLPDILDRLAELGVAAPEGDELGGLPVRRAVLEWVLRREAERTPGLRIHPQTAVQALLHDGRKRQVVGVRTGDGAEVDADLVVDCGGRRSPVARWVTEAGYQREPSTRMSCGIVYYTRYYEAVPGRDVVGLTDGGVEVYDDGFMAHALAAGDQGTTGAIFVAPAAAPELRALGTAEGWEAAVRFVPRMAEVLTDGGRRPIMDPAAMHGLDNVHSPWQADGIHGPRGLAHLGDTWLVTNPNLAWGSSIALAHANALADAVADHGTDIGAGVDDYRARTIDEVDQRFAMACETDRSLQRRWGLLDGPPTVEEVEREAVLFALGRLARHGDRDTARRLRRRSSLLELPDELWHDDQALTRAREELARKPYDPDRRTQALDRDRLFDEVGLATAAVAPA